MKKLIVLCVLMCAVLGITFVPMQLSQAQLAQQMPPIITVRTPRPVGDLRATMRTPRPPRIPRLPRTLPTPTPPPVVEDAVVRVNPASELEGMSVPDMIRATFPNEQEKALRVAKCESNFRPEARNGSHYGVYQISVKYHSHRIAAVGRAGTSLFDPVTNVLVARHLRDEQGWRPWVCK